MSLSHLRSVNFLLIVVNRADAEADSTATLIDLLSPVLVPQFLPAVISPILSTIASISTFPLIVILLHSQATRLNSKATRFWYTLGFSQTAAFVSWIFDILVAGDHGFAAAYALRIAESIFSVLWIIGIMSVFYRKSPSSYTNTDDLISFSSSAVPPPRNQSAIPTPSTFQLAFSILLQFQFISSGYLRLPEPPRPLRLSSAALSNNRKNLRFLLFWFSCKLHV